MKPKSPRTVDNEKYCLKPIREYFGAKPAAAVTLADCDKYLDWRMAGGYVANFKVRGKPQSKRTRGGTRAVDLELTILANVLALAVRRRHLTTNPLSGRGRYTSEDDVRHCREVAPTPHELKQIVHWLGALEEQFAADFTRFLAYSGLRIGEALMVTWGAVNWSAKLIHVKRQKRGILPWVPMLPEMQQLLTAMKSRASDSLLFPSARHPGQPRDYSSYRRRLAIACRKLEIRHVTPHGLRSYFVTQARQSGLTDAEIAMLIGDKSGPAIIAQTYGDVRPEHLMALAQKIQLTAATRGESK
jgi:integrase